MKTTLFIALLLIGCSSPSEPSESEVILTWKDGRSEVVRTSETELILVFECGDLPSSYKVIGRNHVKVTIVCRQGP